MIDARELRIGNYLEKSLKSGQGRKLIDKIGCQDIVRIFENTGSFNYEPIPLTEEITRQFGWSVNVYVHKEGKRFLYYTTDDCFWLADESFENDEKWAVVCKMQYVHEAQNLCYALYKEELEINL